MRRDVMPPWLWPASQNDLMFSRPNSSNTRSTTFCRNASSASATHRRARLGGGGGGRGDDEAVLVLEVDDREVVPLPVADRSGAVQVQHEHDFFVRLQVARVVEEELAAGLRLDGVAVGPDLINRAVRFRTVDPGRRAAAGTLQGAGLSSSVNGNGEDECRNQSVSDSVSHPGSSSERARRTLLHTHLRCEMLPFLGRWYEARDSATTRRAGSSLAAAPISGSVALVPNVIQRYFGPPTTSTNPNMWSLIEWTRFMQITR